MATNLICAVSENDNPRPVAVSHVPRKLRCKEGETQRYLREVVLTHESDECLIWPFSRGATGYCQISYGGKRFYVHRIVCQEVHGTPPAPEYQAAHSCATRACVNHRHLSWKTAQENADDKDTHGTHCRGEANVGARLTEAQVREIRACRGVVLQRELAKRYGIRKQQIGRIQMGKDWGWLR